MGVLVFPVRDFEHRQHREGVFCPPVLLRVFTKRKRFRRKNQDSFLIKSSQDGFCTFSI